MEVSKVQLESWHVGVAKLHDFLTWPTIDQAHVIPSVVVCITREGLFQLKRALACRYQLGKDSSAQPLMLGKAIVDGLGLIDANLYPCPAISNFDINGWVKEGTKVNQTRDCDPC